MFSTIVHHNRYRLRLEQEIDAMSTDSGMVPVETAIAKRQTELMQVHDSTELSMELLNVFSERVMRESYSFTGTPEQMLVKIGLANSDDIVKGDDALNKEIQLVDWYMHETGKEGQRNGEVFNVIRTVLFDKDGTRYSTTSDWVARDVYRIAVMRGKQPLSPPYRCKLVAVKGGQFGKVFRLVPCQAG